MNRGKFTGVKEYYLDAATEVLDAAEITGHVPRFIPGDVFKIAASGTEDCLCLLTDQKRNEVFVYRFYWAENEKMQASWSKWEFPAEVEVLNADFIESTLYLVVKRADGIHLEYIDLEPGKVEPDWNIPVHLDQMVTASNVLSVVFDEGNPLLDADDVTRVKLPYRLDSNDPSLFRVVAAPGGQRSEGQVITDFTLSQDGDYTVVTLPGN